MTRILKRASSHTGLRLSALGKRRLIGMNDSPGAYLVM